MQIVSWHITETQSMTPVQINWESKKKEDKNSHKNFFLKALVPWQQDLP